MAENIILSYTINDLVELNLAYMPFINDGGLFVPTQNELVLGAPVLLDLHIPSKDLIIVIDGVVVWITPKNALYHVLAGGGIQFTGANAAEIKKQLESYLDKKVEIGGYTYGMSS